MTFKTTLEDFHSKLFRTYFPVATEIGDQFIEGDNRRVVVTVNGAGPYKVALMNMDGGFYILVNSQMKKKIGAKEGDALTVDMEKDRSEYGHEVPESFEALLEQDDEGRAIFKSLTMGKQRGLIYIVKKVKNVDSQISKGLAIMHHLKETNGDIEYKRLNELIKEYNHKR